MDELYSVNYLAWDIGQFRLVQDYLSDGQQRITLYQKVGLDDRLQLLEEKTAEFRADTGLHQLLSWLSDYSDKWGC